MWPKSIVGVKLSFGFLILNSLCVLWFVASLKNKYFLLFIGVHEKLDKKLEYKLHEGMEFLLVLLCPKALE